MLTNAPIAMRMGQINELAEKTGSQIIPADATSIEDLENLVAKSMEILGGKLDFVLHSGGGRLVLNGEDISGLIRTPEITMLASAVSARPVVRAYLLDLQRNMGREKAAVFEGRDMGTVVFPEADVKFFLDASNKTRAQRRFEELKSKTTQTLAEVERDMQQRDRNDSTRDVAPLKPAPTAVIIDSTDLNVEQVVDKMVSHILR